MKIKTDIYTKVILTAIAVFLGVIIVKDVDFITKAHAGELDLSNMRIEQAANANNDREVTFYIYENDKLTGGFGNSKYNESSYYSESPYLSNKPNDAMNKTAYINQVYDIPKYIVTTRKGSFWLQK